MDFSKFSTKDLEYLKVQKLDKVSTDGLVELQRQLSGVPADTSDKSVPYNLLMSPAEWEKTNAGATIQRERPAEPTVQKPQTTLDRIPILREAVGGFDAALAATTPLVTAPVGAYYGLGRQAIGSMTGNQYAPNAEAAIMKGMESTAYRPQTEIGQKAMEGLGNVLETSKLAPTPMMGVVPQKIPAKGLFGADPRSLEFGATPIDLKIPYTDIKLTKAPLYVPTVGSKLFKQSKVDLGGVPEQQFFQEQATNLFNQAQSQGITLKKNVFQANMKNLPSRLRQEGYTPSGNFPDVNAAIKELTSGKQPVDFTEIQSLRTMIKNGQASVNANERRIATRLLDEFDDYMANMPVRDIKIGSKEALKTWQEARDSYAKFKKSEIFTDMLDEAQLDRTKFTQSGTENSLAKQMRQLAKNEKRMRLFSKGEQDAIIEAAKGSDLKQTLKFVGRFAPTSTVSALPTIALGAGDMFTGGAFAGATTLGRMGATKMGEGAITDLAKFMRSGLPNRYETTPRNINLRTTGAGYGIPQGLLSDYMINPEEQQR
jgi:hypothetical protein